MLSSRPPLQFVPPPLILFSILLIFLPLTGCANFTALQGVNNANVHAWGATHEAGSALTSLGPDNAAFSPDTTEEGNPQRIHVGGSVRVEAPQLAGTSAISNIIRQVSDEWIGTPYRWGGTTRRGIDCSAFVQTILRDALDIRITRTTASQVHEGESVRRENLLPGDLVFFRRRGTRHVGIYLGNNEFIHASSSRGVTISDLSRGYYNRHYWTSRRIIDDPERFLNSLENQGITTKPDRVQETSSRLAPNGSSSSESVDGRSSW